MNLETEAKPRFLNHEEPRAWFLTDLDNGTVIQLPQAAKTAFTLARSTVQLSTVRYDSETCCIHTAPPRTQYCTVEEAHIIKLF